MKANMQQWKYMAPKTPNNGGTTGKDNLNVDAVQLTNKIFVQKNIQSKHTHAQVFKHWKDHWSTET